MIDVIASEWVKTRSVRSTVYVMAAAASAVLLGAAIAFAMVSSWDSSSPETKANFESADPSVVVLPFAQVCFAAFGILAITSEYATGMIRTSLWALPRRGAMLTGKAVVVGAITLVAGQLVAFAAFFAGRLIAGDRPPPVGPSTSVFEALPSVLAAGLSMTLVGLVGLGLGAVIRSTAGALIAICALLFVLPMLPQFLPSPWDNRITSVMLPYVAPQLAGTIPESLLSPAGALAVMVAYLVASLGAGAVVLTRRDA